MENRSFRAGNTAGSWFDWAHLPHYTERMNGLADMHRQTLVRAMQRLTAQATQTGWQLPALIQKSGSQDQRDYAVDFWQRAVLFTDVLRRRGNNFQAIEQDGAKSVLAYDYDLVVDGGQLTRPVNYSLVAIHPPAGLTVRHEMRPYVIIDPRAGHGSGIGGFKSESEVGVAIRAGHPVYFVIFSTHAMPGQTLADVCRAEAAFIREVRRRHPHSAKPVVIGNCQGGWAAMLLAASNPDLTGPIVINGSPLSYWSGVRGKNPMRYLGGVTGGVTPALMMADLGNGEFDGANLVLNFEALNPGNTWWKKYYDLFAKGDAEAEHFLNFERWWSAFYFMNRDEIRWIVENLFVGNKLARGGAALDSSLHVDLRDIRAPIIVFASHGDNITPVPQALNWITDIYKSVQEIKARGKRIVYTVHDSIGHLGIFVSASVANKQHTEIVSTLQMIEALPPGLYELKIVDVVGSGLDRHYAIALEERQIEDLLAFNDDRDDESPFAAVSRLSGILAEGYRLTAQPMLQALSSESSAKLLRQSNPMRVQRAMFSDQNPVMAHIDQLAQQVRRETRPSAPDNPFLLWEKSVATLVESGWDLFRDWRDGMTETLFYGIYASPMMRPLAADEDPRIAEAPAEDLRAVREVSRALERMSEGGYPNGVIRILILLARARQSVRRDRLERSSALLSTQPPFATIAPAIRERIVSQQTMVVEFEPALALATLPKLLVTGEERQRAMDQVTYVIGPSEEMSEDTAQMLNAIRLVLELPAAAAEKKSARAGQTRR